jgi:hypothetical protein
MFIEQVRMGGKAFANTQRLDEEAYRTLCARIRNSSQERMNLVDLQLKIALYCTVYCTVCVTPK